MRRATLVAVHFLHVSADPVMPLTVLAIVLLPVFWGFTIWLLLHCLYFAPTTA
jgi:hypothetical protein